MGIVLDYTYRIAPAALKAAGATGVCRYLKPDSAPAYRIGLAEYRELVAAGIDVTLNWEFNANDWLGGAARGRAHGDEAVRQARALGYPAGRVIVGSADFDMTRGQWDTSASGYAREFAAAVRAGGYRPGVYGPWDVLGWVKAAGYMDAFWQAGMSWAFSAGRNANAWPGAHLRQRGHKTVAGQDCDWNDILIPNWGGTMTDDYGRFGQPASLEGRTIAVMVADLWGQDQHGVSPWDGKTAGARTMQLARIEKATADVLAAAARDEQRDNAALAAITALATLIQQGGGSVDAAPIIAAVHAVADDTHVLVVQLQQELVDARAELAAVRAELEATMSPAERSSVAPPSAGG